MSNSLGFVVCLSNFVYCTVVGIAYKGFYHFPLMALSLVPPLSAAVRTLNEAILCCRPRDVVLFSLKYFQDEKRPQAAYEHALHSLPFLLRHSDAFVSATCTIFCGAKAFQSAPSDRKRLLEVVRGAMMAAKASTSAATAGSQRKSLAEGERCENSGELADINWQFSVIEEVMKGNTKTLELFEFDSFVVVLRLYLLCWVVVLWVKSMVSSTDSFGELNASLKKYVLVHFVLISLAPYPAHPSSFLSRLFTNRHVTRHKSALFWEQLPHPLRHESLAVDDAQLLCKLLGNALSINQDLKHLCQHVLRDFLSSLSSAADKTESESSPRNV